MAGVTGGDKLRARLETISRNLSAGSGLPGVQVGFLEDARYDDGTSVAAIAALNEFGGKIAMPPREQAVYRLTDEAGTKFLRKGKFVKRSKSNFSSTHSVGGYTITIPPRPFFRTMIAANKDGWGKQIARLMRRNKMDVEKSLNGLGGIIKTQLQDSIKAFKVPPNAKSTIRKKGRDKPLIDTGVMYNSVDYKTK